MKKKRIASLILAAMSALAFIAVMTLILLLDMLPAPWYYISNGVMFFAILTAAIYGFITCDENNKKGGGKND